MPCFAWRQGGALLIGFTLRNFRSFLHEQSFSFSASVDRAHESTHCWPTGVNAVPRLSKASIIFGPNGSGKTNFVVALETFRDLVLRSTSYSDVEFAQRYTPFQFSPTGNLPTMFSIDVLLHRVRYNYTIAYNRNRICWERLLVYRTGKPQRWFERVFDASTREDEWTQYSPHFNGPREMWRKTTRSRALFLTTAAQLNSAQLQPLYHWFEHCLDIVFPSDALDVARMATRIKNPIFKSQVLRLLQSVDIKVDDVRIVDNEAASTANRDSNGSPAPQAHDGRQRLEFLYAPKGAKPVWLHSDFEATGAHRLFGLFGPLLETIEQSRLLVIDDFDTNLHPLIARFLIQLITNPTISYRGAQLLLISHNTTLMDLEMLRRDEIWLTELDETRASNLSSVWQLKPRKDEQIAKGYLRGRYGAVPAILPEPAIFLAEKFKE